MKATILIFIFFELVCSNLMGQTNFYDVEIRYSYKREIEGCYCDEAPLNKPLPIVFGGGFYNDTIKVIIEDTIAFREVVTTNSSTNACCRASIESYGTIQEFRMIINNGNAILVVTNKECALVNVDIVDKRKVLITFHCYFPMRR